MGFMLEYLFGQPDHHRPHAAFTHAPVRSEEEAAANWSSQYTSLTSQTYILIYLYVVKVDTGGSLGKSIIYSNPQPCAACDLSGSLLSQ